MFTASGWALADPIGLLAPTRTGSAPPGANDSAPGGPAAYGGYDPRSNPLRGVVPNDMATVSVLMYDSNLNFIAVNTAGEKDALRGVDVDAGANRNGSGRVNVFWDEFVSNGRTIIRAMVSTTNHEALVPATAQVPGPGGSSSPAVYWSWHFGVVDPVNFSSFVTGVTLTRASIAFSTDGGQTYFSTITTTNTIPNRANWNPGSDAGQLLNTVGDGTNTVLLQYEVSYVPNAGSVTLFSAGLVTIFGRRRKRS